MQRRSTKFLQGGASPNRARAAEADDAEAAHPGRAPEGRRIAPCACLIRSKKFCNSALSPSSSGGTPSSTPCPPKTNLAAFTRLSRMAFSFCTTGFTAGFCSNSSVTLLAPLTSSRKPFTKLSWRFLRVRCVSATWVSRSNHRAFFAPLVGVGPPMEPSSP